MKEILIKRIYDAPSANEMNSDKTYRILIDRLWPRGVSKDKANLDEWNKDIAPSTELRKWFNHKEERFEEFTKRYRQELTLHKDDLGLLINISEQKNILLLYGAKNKEFNQAVVLQKILKELQS